MNKAELLDRIGAERARWEALLAMVDEARMDEPGVAGEWSVKDIVAHITWHEREMVGMIRRHALVGSGLWQLALDQRNAEIFKENKDRPLDDVLEESRAVHQQFLDALGTLSEEDLVDPGRFPGMPPDWRPWDVVAGNSYEHYEQHMQDVRTVAQTVRASTPSGRCARHAPAGM